MKLYDATFGIHQKMGVFPGDPPFKAEPVSRTPFILRRRGRAIWWKTGCAWWGLTPFPSNTLIIRVHRCITFCWKPASWWRKASTCWKSLPVNMKFSVCLLKSKGPMGHRQGYCCGANHKLSQPNISEILCSHKKCRVGLRADRNLIGNPNMAGTEARPSFYRFLYLHQPTDEQGLWLR